MRVEARPLKVITEAKTGKQAVDTQQALVLHLHVKNTSADLPIFPMDPAFTRQPSRDDPHPATRLLVGKRTFYGGAIKWPVPPNVTREYEEQQAADALPLKPGETREYVVFTSADPAVLDAVRGVKEPLLWRVQVRRGFISFGEHEIPVTAIIGIEFQREQIERWEG